MSLKRTHFSVPAELWETFVKTAHARDRNAYAVLRRLIAEWVERQLGRRAS